MRNHFTVEVNERASSYHILKSNNLTTGFLFVSSELSPPVSPNNALPQNLHHIFVYTRTIYRLVSENNQYILHSIPSSGWCQNNNQSLGL